MVDQGNVVVAGTAGGRCSVSASISCAVPKEPAQLLFRLSRAASSVRISQTGKEKVKFWESFMLGSLPTVFSPAFRGFAASRLSTVDPQSWCGFPLSAFCFLLFPLPSACVLPLSLPGARPKDGAKSRQKVPKGAKTGPPTSLRKVETLPGKVSIRFQRPSEFTPNHHDTNSLHCISTLKLYRNFFSFWVSLVKFETRQQRSQLHGVMRSQSHGRQAPIF